MAKDTKTSPPVEALDLRDRGLAAFLTWLIPGAGQFYQKRKAKAGIFFVCIVGCFVFGMLLGDGRVVYAQWNPPKFRRYNYLCQIGAGLPALPAVVASMRAKGGAQTLFGTKWYMPPAIRPGDDRGDFKSEELDELHFRLGRRFELGTVFTMIAGLLNVLAIYDAWAGPAYGLARNGPPSGKDEESPAKSTE